MPVPVWEHSSLDLLDGSHDNTAPVLSEDIWKKFDLDPPLDIYDRHDSYRSIDDGLLLPSESFQYDKTTCLESREIRHHDCMWAGLCISKEHNRMLSSKKEFHMDKTIPAGRSLLITRTNSPITTKPSMNNNNINTNSNNNNNKKCSTVTQSIQQYRNNKVFESDGDSPPNSAFNSATEGEDNDDDEYDKNKIDLLNPNTTQYDNEITMLKHAQISIDEKLFEYMLGNPSKAVHVSEVTGQLVRRPTVDDSHHRHHDHHQRHQQQTFNNETREPEESTRVPYLGNKNGRNVKNDHCYYFNKPTSVDMEHLGIQTPSGSDEEIDVVSFEKPTRTPTKESNWDNLIDQSNKSPLSQSVEPFTQNKTITVPRRRGRPPTNPAKLMQLQQQQQQQQLHSIPSEKQGVKEIRPRRTYQRRKNSSPISMSPNSKSSSEDEFHDGEEKKNLHNNMERQRRIELRKLFEELRRLVPEITYKDNTPKVEILKKASVYCNNLTKVAKLKRKQRRLRARLRELRINQAMTRWKE